MISYNPKEYGVATLASLTRNITRIIAAVQRKYRTGIWVNHVRLEAEGTWRLKL